MCHGRSDWWRQELNRKRQCLWAVLMSGYEGKSMAIRGMIRGLLGNLTYELLRNCVRGESTGSQRSLDKHL